MGYQTGIKKARRSQQSAVLQLVKKVLTDLFDKLKQISDKAPVLCKVQLPPLMAALLENFEVYIFHFVQLCGTLRFVSDTNCRLIPTCEIKCPLFD